jgi:branched-chain amino acid transport system permease protein
MTGIDPTAHIRDRHRWRLIEALPWLTAIAAFAIFSDYAALGTQIIIMIIFALSMDMILGYAGIVSLGHAAYFGAGAYATGMMSAHLGWNEPLTGLVIGAGAGGLLGLVSGLVLLRYHGLTLLMLTLAFSILLQEAANTAAPITGGFDGLQGIVIDPIFGQFDNDLWGHNYYWYSLAVLLLVTLLARRVVNSPFGRSLVGVRENVRRMNAIGMPVFARLVAVYTLSAAIAGLAGALFAQSNAFVTLDVLSFARSGTVLIVLVLGGTGRIYGAFVGGAVYMILEDELAKISPEFWEIGVGLVLVAVVMFFRGGLIGAFDMAMKRLRKGGAG